MGHGANRKSCSDPARSETLRMSGSDLHRSWEVSAVPGATRPGGAGKVKDRNPVIDTAEKSDTPIVPRKPPNNGEPAEVVEGRGVAEGNAGEAPAERTQSRETASTGLDPRCSASGRRPWPADPRGYVSFRRFGCRRATRIGILARPTGPAFLVRDRVGLRLLNPALCVKEGCKIGQKYNWFSSDLHNPYRNNAN